MIFIINNKLILSFSLDSFAKNLGGDGFTYMSQEFDIRYWI